MDLNALKPVIQKLLLRTPSGVCFVKWYASDVTQATRITIIALISYLSTLHTARMNNVQLALTSFSKQTERKILHKT